jgi:monofunctional biosynthetic peptidoglycan transglycosylase
VNPIAKPQPRTARRTGIFLLLAKWVAIALAACWLLAALMLVAAKWVDPPTTAVHMERRMQAWMHHGRYRKQYEFVPLRQISPNLQHAVVAAEDARFYQHHGFDWHQIQIAADEDMEGGRMRGASTITQQLVPVAELVLGKQRILELYLNVVEWGPGIYGAQAACHYYDRTSARSVGREEAARLAAILPAPLRRRPQRMNRYSDIILKRMSQMGW